MLDFVDGSEAARTKLFEELEIKDVGLNFPAGLNGRGKKQDSIFEPINFHSNKIIKLQFPLSKYLASIGIFELTDFSVHCWKPNFSCK